MKFLNNDVSFYRIIKSVSSITLIPESIVEKDYYVFMALKLMYSQNNEVMFKGGTSLSKAWRVLNRFSEDIDLNLRPEVPSTDSHRTRLANSVRFALDTLDLDYDKSSIYSRREYNTVLAKYNCSNKSSYLLSDLKIETMANKRGKILNATYVNLPISSYIWDAMGSNPKYRQVLVSFGLEPFYMPVQNMDVTFVEKVMSLTNNYIRGRSERLSRHLYDIYCMGIFGNLMSFNLAHTMSLTKKYLMERNNDICLRQGRPASQILIEALRSDFYLYDFNNLTTAMKFSKNDGITYEMCRDYLLQLATNLGTF